MQTVGIICEYNPLHNGHKKQLDAIRAEFGEDCAIVCLMSGNFVQRGEPAIFHKEVRAQAAVLAGADLVLELPVTCALSSAEGFAAGGVEILSEFCDYLCFGAEMPDTELLMSAAKALLSEEFPPMLREQLAKGSSFPAARQAALMQMGIPAQVITAPNNILAVEYCKAILSSGSRMQPFPIHRDGSYHAELPDIENPSATSLRLLMQEHGSWDTFIPESAAECFSRADVYLMEQGEAAVLARLRTMTDAEFEALPYGSEGLWRRFMRACRSQATLKDILEATKSKRYTRSRLCRMVMCAYLGIDRSTLEAAPPYTRILAFNERGRSVLKEMRKHIPLVNVGTAVESPYWELEKRCSDLYGLFRIGVPAPPAREETLRVFYLPSTDEAQQP